MKGMPSLVAAAVTALAVGTTFAIAGGGDSAQRSSGEVTEPSGDAAAPAQPPSGEGADPAQQPLDEATTDRLAVEAVAPRLPALMGAFRGAQLAQDKLPGGDASEALAQSGDALPGENPELARRLNPVGTDPAFAWPTSDGVCYQWGGSAVCSPTSALEEKGAVLGFSETGGKTPRFDVFVLVRDGIGQIELGLANGQTLVRPVRDNAVRVTLTSQPVEVRLTKPDGTRARNALSFR